MRYIYYACICSVIFALFFANCQRLSIVPDFTNVWLPEGSALKLECIYESPEESASSDTLDFYYNGEIIHGMNNDEFSLTVMKKVELNTITSIFGLEKAVTEMTDSGEYQCRTSVGNLQSTTNVHIFKVIVTSDTLEDGDTSLILQCKPVGLDPTDDVQINWSRTDANITTDSKYKVYATNSSLEILSPERADMGQYQCELVFYPGTDHEQRFKPPPLTVTGNITVDSGSNSNNAIKSVVVIMVLVASRLL